MNIRKRWKTFVAAGWFLIAPVRWIVDQVGRGQTVSSVPVLKWLVAPWFPPMAFIFGAVFLVVVVYESSIRKLPAGFVGLPEKRRTYRNRAIVWVIASAFIVVVLPFSYGTYRRYVSKGTVTHSRAMPSPVQSDGHGKVQIAEEGNASPATKLQPPQSRPKIISHKKKKAAAPAALTAPASPKAPSVGFIGGRQSLLRDTTVEGFDIAVDQSQSDTGVVDHSILKGPGKSRQPDPTTQPGIDNATKTKTLQAIQPRHQPSRQ